MSLGAALEEVCDNVMDEPTLQPITGESIDKATAIMDERAWLDIVFWGDVSKELTLMLVFLTLLPLQMVIIPCKPPTKYTRDGRCGPMISKSEKSSMVHSHHS